LPDVFNPWFDLDSLDIQDYGPQARRDRLRRHFNCLPRYLLVGEAPGYQGCHFSGVPFTNERLLLDGRVPRVEVATRFTRRDKPWSEPSATVVWGTLHDLGIAETTVMWNAFPWHPHKPGDPMSNRTPTRDELLAGGEILRQVVQLFDGATVVAVGRKAEALLSTTITGRLGFAAVRHPSMGGANAFRARMREIVPRVLNSASRS